MDARYAIMDLCLVVDQRTSESAWLMQTGLQLLGLPGRQDPAHGDHGRRGVGFGSLC